MDRYFNVLATTHKIGTTKCRSRAYLRGRMEPHTRKVIDFYVDYIQAPVYKCFLSRFFLGGRGCESTCNFVWGNILSGWCLPYQVMWHRFKTYEDTRSSELLLVCDTLGKVVCLSVRLWWYPDDNLRRYWSLFKTS